MRDLRQIRSLALGLLLLRCADGGHGIAGHWRSDPRPTQLGMMVEELCLRSDGTYVAHAKTRAGTLTSRGRYEVHSDTLRLIDNNGGLEENEIVLRGGILVMHEKGSDSQLTSQYHRQRSICW